MGSFTSKDFIDMVEEDIPNTPVSNKRLVGLDFDPRSPTVGISRTPIQVEKTPQKVDDPRSPTIGICRTPIVSGDDVSLAAHNASEGDISPVSSVNISGSISNCSLTDIQPLTLQAALDSLPPLDLDDDEDEEAESGYHTPELPMTDTAPHTPEPPIVDTAPHTPTCPIVEQRTNIIEKERTPAKLVIDSKLKSASFQVHSDDKESMKDTQRSPLRVVQDGLQRSPLGKRNIDVSSPRHIMQRKQTNKLTMLKAMANSPIQKSSPNSPCRTEVANMGDKENMSM